MELTARRVARAIADRPDRQAQMVSPVPTDNEAQPGPQGRRAQRARLAQLVRSARLETLVQVAFQDPPGPRTNWADGRCFFITDRTYRLYRHDRFHGSDRRHGIDR